MVTGRCLAKTADSTQFQHTPQSTYTGRTSTAVSVPDHRVQDICTSLRQERGCVGVRWRLRLGSTSRLERQQEGRLLSPNGRRMACRRHSFL